MIVTSDTGAGMRYLLFTLDLGNPEDVLQFDFIAIQVLRHRSLVKVVQ
jgi:hypothetical protein